METTENQVDYLEADVQPTPPLAINPDVPPLATTASIKYAGFWIRFVANFLDGIIISLLSLIPVLILSFLGADILSRVLSYIISFGYFIILTYNKEATWGKMALGLKVIPSEKEKLSLGQVVLRETIGKIVSGIILGIGYIMAGFTERKEALHDKIAKTNVIYADPSKKNNVWIIVVVLIFFLITIVGILAAIVLVSLNSAKQKAKAASFKAEASSVLPSLMMACDERAISIEDLGTPTNFDPSVAMSTLVQDCGSKGSGTFSITINGINEMSAYNAVCTESSGCTVK
jgi:uncharacterized RDD family membrane protein YckC